MSHRLSEEPGSVERCTSEFADAMAARGVRRVRCVTSVVNVESVAFHEAIGFRVTGHKPDAGVDGGEYVQLERELPLAPEPAAGHGDLAAGP